MATVTLTIKDLDNGNVEVDLTSDPMPDSQEDVTDAHRLGFMARMAIEAATDDPGEAV